MRVRVHRQTEPPRARREERRAGVRMQQERDAFMRVERVKVGLDGGGEFKKGREECVCVEEKRRASGLERARYWENGGRE